MIIVLIKLRGLANIPAPRTIKAGEPVVSKFPELTQLFEIPDGSISYLVEPSEFWRCRSVSQPLSGHVFDIQLPT